VSYSNARLEGLGATKRSRHSCIHSNPCSDPQSCRGLKIPLFQCLSFGIRGSELWVPIQWLLHLCELFDSPLQVPLEEVLLLVQENVKDDNAQLPLAAWARSIDQGSVHRGSTSAQNSGDVRAGLAVARMR
jgi:hypothetical protein